MASPPHRVIAAIVCFASMFKPAANAEKLPTPPSNEVLRQCIYLARTSLVEASSDIAGETYILTVHLETRKPMNVPTKIVYSVGSAHFAVPGVLFKDQYAMAATTHLFKLDEENIGFVVFCGDGERAKRCLFRINTRKHVVRREDWSSDAKLLANSEYLSLEESK